MSELLTVKDVAIILKVAEDTVVRRFSKVKGVIDLGTGETRHKRRYRVLRIPKSVVEAHLAKLSGATVTIEVPERAERRRKSPGWEDRAIRNLAKAGLQNGATLEDKAAYRRIAERARLLTSVPENRWSEIEWFEEEE
jgi:hypothetical protein